MVVYRVQSVYNARVCTCHFLAEPLHGSQVKKLFPSARQLTNTWHSVVKIQQSLYREAPGLDPYRPDQTTPVPNFFLAGSYTKQDYIDSMEGATLSGRQCATAVLEAAPGLAQSRPLAVSRAAVAEPVPA